MNTDEIVRELRTESLYKDKATLEIMDLCMSAANLIESLTARLAEKMIIKLATAEDLLTPEEAVETINRMRKAYRKTKEQLADKTALLEAAIVAQGKLLSELDKSHRRENDARNELCLKCGRYHEAHNGACDGCRWRGIEQRGEDERE